jgi:hypothetical protein
MCFDWRWKNAGLALVCAGLELVCSDLFAIGRSNWNSFAMGFLRDSFHLAGS